eukprot:TRINITY_DN47864_c0_g1_i1.p1 TRINITY_DN47864_c0_g1~~TRINITY_DN47864_c0_g1_i1.p1  ORF type:complete len:556 (+),score=89.42 TRINITY_DN47864_c0_g1_i1:158-1825(+)
MTWPGHLGSLAKVFLLASLVASQQQQRGCRGGSSLIVRYSVLDPDPSRGYVQRTGLPMLKSSLCLAERFLKPAVQHTMCTKPSYVVYTDHGTHEAVERLLLRDFADLDASRIKVINLDEDEFDNERLEAVRSLRLDPVNAASVRRTLADAAILPSQSGRLLLGLDVSFLAIPQELFRRVAELRYRQALYMIDFFHDPDEDAYVPYTLTGYVGPQCPGLLGDFVFLGPGVNISVASIKAKALWYAEQPCVPWRTVPPSQGNIRTAYHGIDQFALSLAVGEAVEPPGPGGCLQLPQDQYLHRGGIGRPPLQLVEAIHDKVLSSCGSKCFDTCSTKKGLDCTNSKHPAPAACQCIWESDSDGTPFLLRHCEGDGADNFNNAAISLLGSTLCTAEWSLRQSECLPPQYVIYAGDGACGQASTLLARQFLDQAGRLRLVNIDIDSDVNFRTFDLSNCTDVRQVGEQVLVLEMTLTGYDFQIVDCVAELQSGFEFGHSSGKTFMMMQQGHMEPFGDAFKATIYFCACGQALGLHCPSARFDEFRFVWSSTHIGSFFNVKVQ